eukprot:355425-Chlamydomonas_euryale.AAC.6
MDGWAWMGGRKWGQTGWMSGCESMDGAGWVGVWVRVLGCGSLGGYAGASPWMRQPGWHMAMGAQALAVSHASSHAPHLFRRLVVERGHTDHQLIQDASERPPVDLGTCDVAETEKDNQALKSNRGTAQDATERPPVDHGTCEVAGEDDKGKAINRT